MVTHIKEIIEDIPIYYINLERSKERRDKLEQELILNNLNFKRVEAIDGKNLNFDEIKTNYEVNPKLSIFEVACTFSHIKTLEEILKDNHEYALVLEDDCSFEYFKNKTLKLSDLTKIKNDWDIIKLGGVHTKYNFKVLIRSAEELIKMDDSGAFAYLVSKNGIKKILDNFKKKKLEVSEHTLFKNCICYSVKPYFTYYTYKQLLSTIRENTKSGFATQNISKMRWDEFYQSTN